MNCSILSPQKTPLEQWIAGKLQLDVLDREALRKYQLRQLNETLTWVKAHSSLYRKRLAAFPARGLTSLEQIKDLPFTTQEDTVLRSAGLLCVSQDEIQRVVTLATSGTGGDPKRIFFTAEDLELALDFFAHGVSAVASPGEKMLIALPGEKEGSVGFQLAKGISRGGVIPVPHGVITDFASALAVMARERVASIIGLPVQILSLAYHAEQSGHSAFRALRSIVLCSDHVSSSLVQSLRARTHADVYEHYGMTEMGLGGGIDCEAHAGYHLRETDFYFEIVDFSTGEPVPDGEKGELVFTTLTRHGMPLVRYRTGDISRFLPELCACGTILKRLERIRNRIHSKVELGNSSLTISMLDEALFSIPGVMDFQATISSRQLQILASIGPGYEGVKAEEIVRALHRIDSITQAKRDMGFNVLAIVTLSPLPLSTAKRRIEVQESI